MDEKPKYKPVPPVSGQWKPGQSGNPAGRPSNRPFKASFERVLKALDPNGDGGAAIDRLNAALYARAVNGDVQAYRELADRYEGKTPQAIGIGGLDDQGEIKGFKWLDTITPPKPIEGPVLEGDGSNDERTEEPKIE